MTELEKENLEYIARIDKILARFKAEKPFYAKRWVDRLTEPVPENSQMYIYIWGAGQWGNDLYERFFQSIGITVSAFIDSDPEKWGRKLWGSIPIISPKEMDPHGRVVIAVNGHEAELKKKCLMLGIPEKNIFLAPISMVNWMANYMCSLDNAFCEQLICKAKELIFYFGGDRRSKEILIEMMSRRLINPLQPSSQDGAPYFIPELPLRPEEAFVDAGAYNGDTLTEFIRYFPAGASRKGVHYYAFECGKINCGALKQNVAQMRCDFSVELYPIALWDTAATLSFFENGTSGSVDDAGEQKVPADRLDNVLAGKKISWIKMDIEGAEMRALAGCATIIQEQKPRLAICIYHRISDFYTIPQYIKSLRNDYKMLLRHHSSEEYDTVLYAY